jgi:hypothetical protein
VDVGDATDNRRLSSRSTPIEYSSVRGAPTLGSSRRLIRGSINDTGRVYPPVAGSYAVIVIRVMPGWNKPNSPLRTP